MRGRGGGVGNTAVFPKSTRCFPPPLPPGFLTRKPSYTAASPISRLAVGRRPFIARETYMYMILLRVYTLRTTNRHPRARPGRPPTLSLPFSTAKTFAVRSHFPLPNDRFSTMYYVCISIICYFHVQPPSTVLHKKTISGPYRLPVLLPLSYYTIRFVPGSTGGALKM